MHPSLHCCVGHTASAPEGREGRYQAGPKGRSLKIGARRVPRLLVFRIFQFSIPHYIIPAEEKMKTQQSNSIPRDRIQGKWTFDPIQIRPPD